MKRSFSDIRDDDIIESPKKKKAKTTQKKISNVEESKTPENETNNLKETFSILQLLAAKNLTKSMNTTSSIPYKDLDKQMKTIVKELIDKFNQITVMTKRKKQKNICDCQNNKDDVSKKSKKKNMKKVNFPTGVFMELKLKKPEHFENYFKKNYQGEEHSKDYEKIKLLFFNFVNDPKLLNKLKIFEYEQILTTQISFKSEKTITRCLFINCPGYLIVDNRNSNAITYDERGISNSKVISHVCNKCNSHYRHNWISSEKGRYFLNPNKSKLFEVTRENVVSTKLFSLFGKATFLDGVGAENWSNRYNEQFETDLDKLTENNQKIAHHTDCELRARTLSNGFYLWSTLKIIFDNKINTSCDELIDNTEYYYVSHTEYQIFKKNYKLKQKLLAAEGLKYKHWGAFINNQIKNPEWAIDEETWNLIEFDEPIGMSDGIYFGKDYKDYGNQHDSQIDGEFEYYGEKDETIIQEEKDCSQIDQSIKNKKGNKKQKNKKGLYYLFIKSDDCTDGEYSNKSICTKTDDALYLKFIYYKDLYKALLSLKNNVASVMPIDKDGTPSLLAQQLYGDGNQKITINLCDIASNLYAVTNCEQLSTLNQLQRNQSEWHQCNHAPYWGNDKTIQTTLCEDHWICLSTKTSLKRNEINEFILYWNTKNNKDNTKSKDAAKKYDKILGEMGSKKERFKKIFRRLERVTWMQYQRNLLPSKRLVTYKDLEKSYGHYTKKKPSKFGMLLVEML